MTLMLTKKFGWNKLGELVIEIERNLYCLQIFPFVLVEFDMKCSIWLALTLFKST